MAYQVILEPGIGQFGEFESPRVHTRIYSWGIFLVHILTCGKCESVSWQHSMKNRRAVGLLNLMRDKNRRQEPGGKRDDTCDFGLSRSWKVDVCEKKYGYMSIDIFVVIFLWLLCVCDFFCDSF